MAAQILTQEKLKLIVHYEPDTGIFRNIARRQGVAYLAVLGSKNRDGYLQLTIEGVSYPAHRLAFLYMEGSLPVGQIDHINHVRDDNRWENIRSVHYSDNHKNKSMQRNNVSGITGVHWDKARNRWRATIGAAGTYYRLYGGPCFLAACCARKSAENEFGFHPNHGK